MCLCNPFKDLVMPRNNQIWWVNKTGSMEAPTPLTGQKPAEQNMSSTQTSLFKYVWSNLNTASLNLIILSLILQQKGQAIRIIFTMSQCLYISAHKQPADTVLMHYLLPLICIQSISTQSPNEMSNRPSWSYSESRRLDCLHPSNSAQKP